MLSFFYPFCVKNLWTFLFWHNSLTSCRSPPHTLPDSSENLRKPVARSRNNDIHFFFFDFHVIIGFLLDSLKQIKKIYNFQFKTFLFTASWKNSLMKSHHSLEGLFHVTSPVSSLPCHRWLEALRMHLHMVISLDLK